MEGMHGRQRRSYIPLTEQDLRAVTWPVANVLFTIDIFRHEVMEFSSFHLDVSCIDHVNRNIKKFKFIFAFLMRCKDLRFCRTHADLQFIKQSFESKLAAIKMYRLNVLECPNHMFNQLRPLRNLIANRYIRLRTLCRYNMRSQTHLDRCIIVEDYLNFVLFLIEHVEEWRNYYYSRREE